MNSNRIVIFSAIVFGVFLIGVTSMRLHAAKNRHRSERARLTALAADVATLARLRVADVHALSREPPEGDLLGSVRESIRTAGLAENTFSRLSTSGEQAVRGQDGYRRKSYRLELGGLDATDLGSFLGVWRAAEPLWTIDGIELNHQRTNRRTRGQSTNGYAVSISMSTVFASGLEGEEREPE